MANGENKSLETLQVWRGWTAIFVVIYHSARAFVVYLRRIPTCQYRAFLTPALFRFLAEFGVDIFFVISGSVMILVSANYTGSARQSLDFMARRIIRIYPMYLFFTLVTIAFLIFYVVVKHAEPHFDLGLHRIVSSLLFIPTFDAGGSVSPILNIGWTLFYEMFFYACFSIVIWLFPRHLVISLAGMLLTFVMLGNLVPMDSAGCSSSAIRFHWNSCSGAF